MSKTSRFYAAMRRLQLTKDAERRAGNKAVDDFAERHMPDSALVIERKKRAAAAEEAKRERNARADLRRRSKKRSLVNWTNAVLLGQPITFTYANRRAEKQEQLLDAYVNTDLAQIHNKGRRRRLRKYLAEEIAQIEATKRQMAPLKLGDSRRDRRKKKLVYSRAARQGARVGGAQVGYFRPAGSNEYASRKRIEATLYHDATVLHAQERAKGGTPPSLSEIQNRLARERGVTWRKYGGMV